VGALLDPSSNSRFICAPCDKYGTIVSLNYVFIKGLTCLIYDSSSINQPFIMYCSINAGFDTTLLVKLVKIAMTK